MKVSTEMSMEYRVRTMQYGFTAFGNEQSAWRDLLAPGGCTCSAGSTCCCTTCGAVASAELVAQ
ncbi:hypothetical protein [Virgisporangium aurantiacum]|uniref:Uncharacterized protein n=1 Tax=Virgisporangium aurantiacum TaxID=175570 RepID=A0A8J3ZLQ3_9ACTN|nr:hypothetical protein [Virgisporangium aurantiacum]GIJ63833.1 hypothetical protein Vau01_113490 [Virgisporangium aurantiacum]